MAWPMSPTMVIEPVEVAALQDAKLHRREVLGLVDHDVAVGHELRLVEFVAHDRRVALRLAQGGRAHVAGVGVEVDTVQDAVVAAVSSTGRGRRSGPSKTRASSISAASALVHRTSSIEWTVGSVQQRQLVVAHETLPGRAQQRWRAEEVVQAALGRRAAARSARAPT